MVKTSSLSLSELERLEMLCSSCQKCEALCYSINLEGYTPENTESLRLTLTSILADILLMVCKDDIHKIHPEEITLEMTQKIHQNSRFQ